MRVGFLQTSPRRLQREANLLEVDGLLAGAPAADLWVLPELFSSGYLFRDREEAEGLAEAVPEGPTTVALVSWARRHRSALVAGVLERGPSGRLFNSAVAVDASGLRGLYRKVHLFGTEKGWATPGDLPFPVLELAGARVGVMICFDWRFPEVARTLALAGAQVIAHPSNLVLPHAPEAMVTRALENRVFTITCDRVGSDEAGGQRVSFIGRSRVVGPDGEVIAEGPPGDPAVAVVEIDPRRADDKRVGEANDLFGDRRPDRYRL
ncbi:MAG TPA: nitrilase-related carbon-nitrogen hydrolase [Myxococcota bacterium]|nr:nitrilase-related carbon-nitrogen hydrolase [Myxococcota bacterium]HQK50152.1 nitrilase-related carbon-nitrogen hydrolase [Myxococcota bacterium]